MIKNYLFVMALFLAGYYPAFTAARPALQRLMGPRYLAAYAITIGAGFFAPNIWLYHFVLIAVFVVTTTDREDAICRYVVMVALIPSITTVLLIGSFYAGTFQVTAPLTIAMLIANVIKPVRDRTQPVMGWRAEDAAVIALYLAFTLGASRITPFTPLLRQMLSSSFDFLLPYYLVRRNVRSAETLRRLIGCVAISAASLAVIAIYEARVGWPLFDAITTRLSMQYGLSAFTVRRGNALRAMASFSTPLLLAYFLVFGLLAWLCSRSLFKNSLVWKGGIVVIAYAMLAPQSRGAFIAIVPAMIVLLVCRRRFAAAAGLLAASGIGAAALFVLQHSSSAVQAFVGGNSAGGYYDYRGLLLHRGMQEGMKHPIFGQSIDDAIRSLADITQGEHIVDLVNTYLTIFLVSGAVGVGGFVLPSLLSFRKLIARARREEVIEDIRSNRAFALAMMTGTYIYIYSVSFVDRVTIYTVLMLAFAGATSTHLIRRAPKKQIDAAPLPEIEDERFTERLVPA